MRHPEDDDLLYGQFGADTFVLLSDPHYQVRDVGGRAVVRIDYRLPSAPGGVNAALGRGVIELERTPQGRIATRADYFLDLQTGSARAGPTWRRARPARRRRTRSATPTRSSAAAPPT